MRKLLIAALLVVVLAVGGLLAAPAFVDWNQYRDDVARAVRGATGYAIDISGGLDLALLPRPVMTAGGVSLRHGDPAPVTADVMRIELAAADLLQGTLRITQMALVRPEITIALDEEGLPVWPEPDDARDTGSGGTFAIDTFLEALKIEDGTIRVRPAGREGLTVEQADLTLKAHGPRGRYGIIGTGRVGGEDLALQLNIGRIRENRPVSIRGELRLPAVDTMISFAGALDEPVRGGVIAGELTVETADINRPLNALTLGLTPGVVTPARLSAEATLALGQLSLQQIDFSAAHAHATGAASIVLVDMPSVALALNFTRLDLDDLPGLKQALAVDLPARLADQAWRRSLSLPTDLDLAVRLEAQAIELNERIVHGLGVDAELSEGTLFLKRLGALLPGGSDIALAGVMAETADGPVFEGEMTATSDNLRSMLDWLGADTSGVPASRLRSLKVTSTVNARADALRLQDATVEFDATTARGTAHLLSGPRPFLDLELTMDAFNLDAYRRADAPPGATGTPLLDRVHGWIAGLDGRVRFEAERLTVAGALLNEAVLDADIENGRLAVEQLDVNDVAGASVSGRLDLSLEAGKPRFGFTVMAAARDPERLMQRLGLRPAPGIRRLTGSEMRLTGEGDLQLITVTGISRIAGGTFDLEVAVTEPLQSAQVVADVKLEHPDPLAVLQAFGVEVPADLAGQAGRDGGLKLEGRITASAGQMAFNVHQLTVGSTAASGAGVVTFGAERPLLNAAMEAERISALPLVGLVSAAGDIADISMELEAETLLLGTLSARDVYTNIKVTAGGAQIEPVRGTVLGGPFEASFTAQPGPEGPTVAGVVSATDVDPGRLLAVLGGPNALTGALRLETRLQTRGRTMAEIVGALSGSAEIDGAVGLTPQSDGSGYATALFGKNLPPVQQVQDLAAVLESSFGNTQAPLAMEISFGGGVARIDAATLDGNHAQAIAYGSWDMSGARLETTTELLLNGEGREPYFSLSLAGSPTAPNVKIAGEWLQGR